MEVSEKKLRAQKRQRSHNKKAYLSRGKSSQAENSNSSSPQNDPDPQPQRVNRRERNEQTPREAESPAANIITAKSETDQPAVDHSHLKRETEEIEKLTKKFAKREIRSNWNRYAVAENVATDTVTEEEALADFSALLQVPTSSGGHLQLKEEQDWSSASDALLNGCFALDLKILSRGMTCIPVYEQLRLPKRILTEEQIEEFDRSVDTAKLYYEATKLEDPSDNSLQILKELLAQRREPKLISEKNMNQTEKPVNILDTNKVEDEKFGLEISLDDNKRTELHDDDVKAFESMSIGVKRSENIDNIKKESVTLNKKQTNEDDCSSTESSKTTFKLDAECLYSDKNKKSVKEENVESPIPFTNTNKSIVNVGSGNVLSDNKVFSTKNKNNISKNEISLLESVQSPVTQNKTHTETQVLDINKASDMHSRAVKTISPAKEMKTDICESKSIRLEDDDELEFLLALKTPVTPQKVTENNPTADSLKDSSFLPGEATTPKPSAAETHSELDSWLDSVLDD